MGARSRQLLCQWKHFRSDHWPSPCSINLDVSCQSCSSRVCGHRSKVVQVLVPRLPRIEQRSSKWCRHGEGAATPCSSRVTYKEFGNWRHQPATSHPHEPDDCSPAKTVPLDCLNERLHVLGTLEMWVSVKFVYRATRWISQQNIDSRPKKQSFVPK